MHRSVFAGIAILGVHAMAGAADLAGLEWHGFASLGYVKSSTNEYLADHSNSGSFNKSEVALNAAWQASDSWRFAAQVYGKDFFADDQWTNAGSVDNLQAPRLTLDLAFVQYTANDMFGVRAGRIKQAYGLYNEVRDLDVARFAALLPQSVYDDRDREQNFAVNGIGIFGDIAIGRAGSVGYQAFGGKVNIPRDGTTAAQYATPDLGLHEVDLRWVGGGQVFWSPPIDGLRVGASYRRIADWHAGAFIRQPIPAGPAALAPVDVDITADKVQSYLLSVEYARDRFTLAGEYQRIRLNQKLSDFTLQFPPGPPFFGASVAQPVPDHPVDTEGWYILGSVRATDRVELGAYASIWSLDVHHRTGEDSGDINNYQHDYALIARYDPRPWWTLKLEGHYVDGTGLLDVPKKQSGYLLGGQPNTSEHWYYTVIRSTVSF